MNYGSTLGILKMLFILVPQKNHTQRFIKAYTQGFEPEQCQSYLNSEPGEGWECSANGEQLPSIHEVLDFISNTEGGVKKKHMKETSLSLRSQGTHF